MQLPSLFQHDRLARTNFAVEGAYSPPLARHHFLPAIESRLTFPHGKNSRVTNIRSPGIVLIIGTGEFTLKETPDAEAAATLSSSSLDEWRYRLSLVVPVIGNEGQISHGNAPANN